MIKILLAALLWIENIFRGSFKKRLFLRERFRFLLLYIRGHLWRSAAGALAALFVAMIGLMFFMLYRDGPRLSEVHFVAESRGTWLIAQDLQKAEIISNAFLFRLGAWIIPGSRLRGGEYRIKLDDSIADIIAAMRYGRPVGHKFTIPEGLTHYQIKNRLRINTLLTGLIGALPEEGRLLPETYLIYRGQKRAAIVRQMHRAHKRLVKKLWAQRAPDLPLKNANQAVVLASIVEKETGLSGERARIAGVFLNRLSPSNYMQLQSDPTVIYALTQGKPLKRSLTFQDLKIDNPYNTYANYGLPPEAIANPGRAAIKAVMNPDKTKDLFFVADGTGGHSFAITYDQHLQNVAKWRKIQNGKAAASKESMDNPPAIE